MKCEYDFCIYFEGQRCILDEISINSLGMCEEALRIDLEGETLEAIRQRQRRTLEEG